jgi:hypothetical protein
LRYALNFFGIRLKAAGHYPWNRTLRELAGRCRRERQVMRDMCYRTSPASIRNRSPSERAEEPLVRLGDWLTKEVDWNTQSLG